MVVVTEPGASEKQVEEIIRVLHEHGFDVHRSTGMQQTVLGAIGVQPEFDHRQIELLPGVAEVLRITEPYKLASRTFKREGSVFDVGGIKIGGDDVVVMAGPCSVESERQVLAVAESVMKSGAKILRGGAFKPRTSPYSFQGLGEEGLRFLRAAADEYKLKVITEVMDKSQIDLVEKYADILQIGARNMQNFTFLKDLGKASKPIMLKRGQAATIEEWLMSAEYILAGGNHQVILCERGIRTFETATRNTMDVGAIPVIKKKSHLPIVADPSHGIGIRDKVIPMARACVAAGADGIMVEVHNDPDHARSDGAQSLFPEQFAQLMKEVRIIAEAIGRKIA
jgi:3-deoxy-7-phosphoheptulonate synthase